MGSPPVPSSSRRLPLSNFWPAFEAVRQIGAEGVVSKRAGSPYLGGAGRDWLKTKVIEVGALVIAGFIEREAVAELRDRVLVPAGLVNFGLASKGLWERLDR